MRSKERFDSGPEEQDGLGAHFTGPKTLRAEKACSSSSTLAGMGSMQYLGQIGIFSLKSQ